MANPKTIEEKVAQTVLQMPSEITVGNKTYEIAPPSTATLILVSAAVSRLPHLHLDDKRVVEEVLHVAKDCRVLGDIAATLIIGAKHINDLIEIRHTESKRHLWGLFRTRREVVSIETRKERLSRELLEDMSPKELHNLIAGALMQMQVGDFFALTTFLTEINLIRQTKVETEATASGQ